MAAACAAAGVGVGRCLPPLARLPTSPIAPSSPVDEVVGFAVAAAVGVGASTAVVLKSPAAGVGASSAVLPSPVDALLPRPTPSSPGRRAEAATCHSRHRGSELDEAGDVLNFFSPLPSPSLPAAVELTAAELLWRPLIDVSGRIELAGSGGVLAANGDPSSSGGVLAGEDHCRLAWDVGAW